MIRVNGLADVCFEPCGNNTFIAFGVTIVEVIIKNMSNRNIISVIDDIENASIVLVFLLSIVLCVATLCY